MADMPLPNDPQHGAAPGPMPGGATPPAAGAMPYWQPRPLRGSSTDKTNTILLITLGPVLCVVGSIWGMFSVMATDSCGVECGAGANWGIGLMVLAPWVVWLISSVWATVRVVRKKTALRIMLAGVGLAAIIYVLANVLLFVAIG